MGAVCAGCCCRSRRSWSQRGELAARADRPESTMLALTEYRSGPGVRSAVRGPGWPPQRGLLVTRPDRRGGVRDSGDGARGTPRGALRGRVAARRELPPGVRLRSAATARVPSYLAGPASRWPGWTRPSDLPTAAAGRFAGQRRARGPNGTQVAGRVELERSRRRPLRTRAAAPAAGRRRPSSCAWTKGAAPAQPAQDRARGLLVLALVATRRHCCSPTGAGRRPRRGWSGGLDRSLVPACWGLLFVARHHDDGLVATQSATPRHRRREQLHKLYDLSFTKFTGSTRGCPGWQQGAGTPVVQRSRAGMRAARWLVLRGTRPARCRRTGGRPAGHGHATHLAWRGVPRWG